MSSSTRIWPDWVPQMLWIQRKCPRCNSVKFKQAELRPLDGLLAMFAVRPIRCMFCWRRFYWFAFNDVKAE